VFGIINQYHVHHDTGCCSGEGGPLKKFNGSIIEIYSNMAFFFLSCFTSVRGHLILWIIFFNLAFRILVFQFLWGELCVNWILSNHIILFAS